MSLRKSLRSLRRRLFPRPVPDSLREARVPIVVGVTGHRKLGGNVAQLEAVVARECRKLVDEYPDTPFVFLSGLAEGADRLAARAALANLTDCKLIAVLPMPREDFETDFPGSREEFAALMKQASAVVVMETQGDAWRSDGAARDALYAKVGAVIAEHAQVLFALWDNQQSRGTGGTAEVVEWFRKGYAPKEFSRYAGELSPLDPPETGLLLRIDPATGAVEEGAAESPHPTATKIGALLRLTDVYNGALGRQADTIMRKRAPLQPDVPKLKAIDEVFAAADALAVAYAQRVRRMDKWMFGLALLAFAFFAGIDKWALPAYGYAVVALAMLGLWRVMRRWRIENRFLEYRALAEGLRVLFYWRLAGIERSAWLGYLSKHSGLVHWVRHALRAVEFQQAALAGGKRAPATPQSLAEAGDRWVDAQIAFYETARTQAMKAKGWNRLIWIALIISYVFAGVFVVYGVHQRVLWAWPDQNVALVLQLGLGFAAAISIATRTYLTRRADEDLIKQYSSALQIFRAARHELDEAARREKAGLKPDWPPEDTLERLGLEALREHGEWLWLRHSRPFEVPQ